jgi:hypothetical protein
MPHLNRVNRFNMQLSNFQGMKERSCMQVEEEERSSSEIL